MPPHSRWEQAGHLLCVPKINQDLRDTEPYLCSATRELSPRFVHTSAAAGYRYMTSKSLFYIFAEGHFFTRGREYVPFLGEEPDLQASLSQGEAKPEGATNERNEDLLRSWQNINKFLYRRDPGSFLARTAGEMLAVRGGASLPTRQNKHSTEQLEHTTLQEAGYRLNVICNINIRATSTVLNNIVYYRPDSHPFSPFCCYNQYIIRTRCVCTPPYCAVREQQWKARCSTHDRAFNSNVVSGSSTHRAHMNSS